MTRRERTSAPTAALLLLDAGNSRVKWALLSEGATVPAEQMRFAARGVLELAALRRSDAPLRRLAVSAPSGTRILACNVAGAQLEQRVRSAAARAGLSTPQFVHTAAQAAGVRNGYAEPWRLGVDRWVALIGAHAMWPRQAQCLVGIGSALTIDLLASSGRHRGGCIAPGPRMMIESLLRETAGIRRRSQLGSDAALSQALLGAARGTGRRRGAADTLFTRSTREALLAGARHACAALIERATQQAQLQLGADVQVVLSGGGADVIAPLLQIAHRREDDLVLRGLAVLARAGRAIA